MSNACMPVRMQTTHQSPNVETIAGVLMVIVHCLRQRNAIKTENDRILHHGGGRQ